MTSRAELIQQLIDNIFAGNVEISTHTNKTPLAFQLTRRKFGKNLRVQLQKWQQLSQNDPTSKDFLKQTDLVYNLVLEGRDKYVVHGKFEIHPEIDELRIENNKLNEQNRKLFEIAQKYEPMEADGKKRKKEPYL